ncbi:MAG: hypothetical protein JW818_06480, partial [Pirellulales bacterium]|nr:hypothetical protein [Pirellulales bacterium]
MGVIVAILVRTWLVSGLVAPCVVAGGSMAPTLLGDHRTITCEECGFTFACEADDARAWPVALCPNCGYQKNDRLALPVV